MNQQERAIRRAKARWGENHWWDSGNARTRAYYQMQEETLLYSFSQFHEDIEVLLGRPVWTHEFGVNWKGLQQEAKAAWHGTPYSEDGKRKSIQDSIKALGTKVIFVEPPEEA